ncbi:MAG: carbohydrate ABC transporter permease [Firmicutes bacterium]|nr:carbohydrate ABC transporter permease [Bacillota bacterium]
MYKISENKKELTCNIFKIFNTMILTLIVMSVLVPIADIVLRSLSHNSRFDVSGFRQFGLFDDVFIWGYTHLFQADYFLRPLAVSALTAISVVALGLFVTAVSAFIIVSRDMPGSKLFKKFLLFALVFGVQFFPEYAVMRQTGLYNTIWPIIVPLSFNIYNIMLLRNFFDRLPKTLFEAAEIDGCSPVGIFFNIALPLAKAPLSVVGLLFATAAWNEYYRFIVYSKYWGFQYEIMDKLYYAYHCYEYGIPPFTYLSIYLVTAIVPVMIAVPLVMKNFQPVIGMGCVKD